MLSDLDTSKTEMDLFKQAKDKGKPFGIELNCQVLQNGAWDIDKNKFEKMNLPPLLEKCLKEFNDFYIGRHKNHKLQFAYGLGDMEVQYLNYLKKNYKSTSTLAQYLILINLEKRKELVVSQLAELIGISDIVVANEATFLLYHPQFNKNKLKTGGLILSDAPEKADIDPNHKIWINPDFTCNNLTLVTLPTKARMKPGEEQNSLMQEEQNLKTYRNIIIDATITRIMKGRIGQKTSHAWLIADVAKQINLFQAQPPQIKERIEALIEKSIIKRKDDDKSCYEYVA